MVISAKEQRCYDNLFAKNAFDVGCTQARETTLREYTLMMVVATWTPPALDTVGSLSVKTVPWKGQKVKFNL
jgi:hypothetical protein